MHRNPPNGISTRKNVKYPARVTIRKEFKVGLLAVTAILVLYFGVDFLKGSDVFSSSRKYYVSYAEVDGLASSNPVMYNGFQIGLIRRINIYQGREKPILVTLEISKNISIGDSAKAILSNNGLLGGKMIVLDPGILGTTLKSDTLFGYIEPGLASMLGDKAQPVVDNFNQLMVRMDDLIASFSTTADKLNATLISLEKLSNNTNGLVENTQKDITTTAHNLEILSKNLLSTENELAKILKKVDVLGDSLTKADLAGTIHSIHRTSDQLAKSMESINQGKGSIGKLLKNDSLYNNMTASTVALNALLVDFKANPKRYVHFSVFGSKDKKSK